MSVQLQCVNAGLLKTALKPDFSRKALNMIGLIAQIIGIVYFRNRDPAFRVMIGFVGAVLLI